MQKFWTFVAFLLFPGTVGVCVGHLIHKHRERIRASWDMLRGHTELKEGALRCARVHVEADMVQVKRDRLKDLELAADELKIARGFIAHAEAIIPNPKTTYAETVNDVL